MLTVHECISVTRSYFLASSSPGDYEISVKFNDQHIPDSPYLVPVVAPVNDARRLTVTGLQVRHEETPPHSAVLLKGSGAQLHKNVMSMGILFPYRADGGHEVQLVWVFIQTHNFYAFVINFVLHLPVSE